MSATTAAPAIGARKLGPLQFLGYAAGDAANNLAFSMTSFFLLIYYTDVVGITAAAAGTLFLVVRIWDGLADLFAGRTVDRTMTRWGKFRPFFIVAGLPVLLLSVATFTVPTVARHDARLLGAYLTYGLLGLAYSLVNIPYGSLAAAMTQVPSERAKLATSGSRHHLTTLMLAFVVSPQIKGPDNLQRSLTDHHSRVRGGRLRLYLFPFATASESVQRDVPRSAPGRASPP